MPAEMEKRKCAINVTTGQIRPLVEMAAAAGANVKPMLAALGLPQNLDAAPAEAPARLSSYYRLQREISIAVEDETCHLSQRQLLPGTTDFILSHLDGAKSLFDAMKVVAKYYNLLHGGEYNSVRRRGGAVTFATDDRNFPYTLKGDAYTRFSMECVQIFLHCMLATIAPTTAASGLKGVHVTRLREEEGAGQLAFWRVPVRYGAEVYAIDYAAEAAMAPMKLPPPELLTAGRVYAQVIDMIDARETEARPRATEELVRESLRQGVIDQGKIADLIGISVATLRRRLADEGASFRELRKAELNGAAQRLLRKRRPIADVAEELGFSEFRSFNRAFKEWNGVTPKAFIDGLETGRS